LVEPRRAQLVAQGLVALSGLAVYLNALANPPVYDDLVLRQRAPALLSPRALTELSHLIDRRLFGDGVVGPHLTSVLLHALVAVLVLRLAWALAPPPRRFAVGIAAGLLFALHPIQSEAVGYVSARADLLAAAASLSATLAWLRWRRAGGASLGAAPVALLAAALLSKESSALLPLFWLIGERCVDSDDAAGSRRRVLGFNLPLVALVGAAGLARLLLNLSREGGNRPGLPHVLAQAEVQWRYFALLLWPRGQTLYHDVPRLLPSDDARAWLALFGLFALAGAALLLVRQRRPAALALVWLLLFLVPGAVLPLKDAMAEHRLYLPSIGAAIIAAFAIGQLPARLGRGLLLLILPLLAAATLARNRVWHSPVALWSEAARAAPRAWPPYYALGDALRVTSRCAEALDAYAEAIRRGPNALEPRVNRALCLAELGRLAEAEALLREALLLAPHSSFVHNDLGMVAEARGRREEARAWFTRALALDPGNGVSRANLARLR
jgi:tetratricopeptide (TPR) repeat protein